MAYKCPSCGSTLSGGESYCPSCGKSLGGSNTGMVECQNCGRMVSAKLAGPSPGGLKKVCPDCYEKLSDWRERQGPHFY